LIWTVAAVEMDVPKQEVVVTVTQPSDEAWIETAR